MKRLIGVLFEGITGDAKEDGSNMASHMAVLSLLSSEFSFGDVVELGVGRGWSGVALLSGLRDGARMHSYDIDPESDCMFYSTTGVRPEEAAMRSFSVSDAAAAASRHKDGSVSLVFDDASHFYAETIAELEAWLPKMHPQGVICGHDYYLHLQAGWEEVCGVKRAVDEFAAAHEGRFRLQVFPNDMGLFVLWPR